jgi:hypothetical protein
VNLTLWDGFRRSYAGAWRFVGALPAIAAIAIGVEGLQHVVEFLEGMYRNSVAMHAHASDVGRTAAGVLKIGWLLLLQFWVARFVASGSVQATLAYDAVAVRKFAMVMVVWFVMSVTPVLFPILFVAAHVSGLVAASVLLPLLVLLIIPQIIMIPWSVSAALGDPRASFDFASRRSRGSRLWAVILVVLTSLPLMALHYALSYAAVGRSPPMTIMLLVLDATIVAILGVVIAATWVTIAQKMAGLDGDILACGPFAYGVEDRPAGPVN